MACDQLHPWETGGVGAGVFVIASLFGVGFAPKVGRPLDVISSLESFSTLSQIPLDTTRANPYTG